MSAHRLVSTDCEANWHGFRGPSIQLFIDALSVGSRHESVVLTSFLLDVA